MCLRSCTGVFSEPTLYGLKVSFVYVYKTRLLLYKATTLHGIRVLNEKVTFANKFPLSLKNFIFKRKKSSLVSIIYILKIINTCQDIVQISVFISYVVSLLWVKLCHGILPIKVWRAGLQSCS